MLHHECHQIVHALTCGLARYPDLKVLRPVVGTLPVLVVDVLPRPEGTAEHRLRNDVMLLADFAVDADTAVAVFVEAAFAARADVRFSRSHAAGLVQAARVHRQRIESGELPPGAPVPSIRGMSQEFGIAGTTAQKVIEALKADGLVVTSPMGTFVAERG